jgi:hypothetical protein
MYIYIYISVQEPDKFFILYLYPYLSYICLQPLQRRTCYKLLPWVRFREPNRKNATEGFGGQRVVGWLGGWMDGWVGGWLAGCVYSLFHAQSAPVCFPHGPACFHRAPLRFPPCPLCVARRSSVCSSMFPASASRVPCFTRMSSRMFPHVPACSPHVPRMISASSMHGPRMFPACSLHVPACSPLDPACSPHVPAMFPPCPLLFFEPRQVFG